MPHYLSSYIDLVDETGRVIRDDAYRDIGVSREQDAVETKRGFISEITSRAIDEIGINPDDWLDELKGFKSIGYSAVGTAEQLKEFSKKTKRKWALGIKLTPALE